MSFRLPTLNGELKGWNMKSNPEFNLLNKKDSLFSQGKKIYLLVTPKSDSLYQVFEEVKRLETELREEFTNAEVLSPTVFYSKMIRNWNTRNNSLTSFLKEGSEVPLLKQLIAKDHTSFLIIFSKADLSNVQTKDFDSIIAKYRSNVKVEALSELHLAEDIKQNMSFDLKYILSLIALFFILYMGYAFRTYKAIVYTLFLIVVSIISTAYLFSFLGMTINVTSILSFPIVLILALSDALHLLSGYAKNSVIENKDERITATLKLFVIPSFFSSFTTAVAFFSFYIFGESTYVQEFGLITAIALMLEFVLAYLVSPIFLYWIDIKGIRDKELNYVAHFLYNKRVPITLLFGAITIISAFFIRDVRIESSMDALFPRGSRSEHLNEELKKNYFDVLEASLIITPASNLTSEQTDSIVESIAASCRSMNGVVNVNSASNTYLFKSKLGKKVDLFKVLGERSPYFNENTGQYLIDCQFKDDEFIRNFARSWRSRSAKDYSIEVVSNKLMMDRSNYMISISLIESLSTAGLSIFVVILLLTRSVLTSVLSLFPNIIPLGLVVLLYVFFELDMNMITSFTMVIALGLLDDDTIHILYRKLWLKQPMEELNFSVLSSGLLLSFTFLIFIISKYFPVQQFGFVTALIFLIGVICEMTVMVWILEYVTKPRKK